MWARRGAACPSYPQALAIVALLIQGAICVVPDVQGNTLVPSIRRFDSGCFQAHWAMKAYLVLLDWQIGIALIVGLSALAWSAIVKEVV